MSTHFLRETRKPKTYLIYNPERLHLVSTQLLQDLRRMEEIELWEPDKKLATGERFKDQTALSIRSADYLLHIFSATTYKLNDFIDFTYELEYSRALQSKYPGQTVRIIQVSCDYLWHSKHAKEPFTVDLKSVSSGIVQLSFPDPIVYEGAKSDFYQSCLNLLRNLLSAPVSDEVITFDFETVSPEKSILVIAREVNSQLIQYMATHPKDLKNIDRRLFEELVAELFHGFGFQVELTSQTRDGGRDVIAIRDVESRLKYLIECKRPNEGNIIGIKPVRELFGVKTDEKASKAIIVTTSYFSREAMEFVERNKWELEARNFDGLMDWISLYQKGLAK